MVVVGGTMMESAMIVAMGVMAFAGGAIRTATAATVADAIAPAIATMAARHAKQSAGCRAQ